MRNSRNNKILTKNFLGVLVLLAVLTPLVFTFSQKTAHAQNTPAPVEERSLSAALTGTSQSAEDKAILDAMSGATADTAVNQDGSAPFADDANWYQDGETQTQSGTQSGAPTTQSAARTGTQNAESSNTWGQKIGNIILNIAAFFTWVGGNILDFALRKLVFGMGALINGQGFGTTIDSTWRLIRDICNLAFIFAFIYTGIRTIIDPEAAETKRFLSRIIIGALLINFSLFIVKFVVDFANFLSLQLYSAMIGTGGDISATFAKLLGLSSFYAPIRPDVFNSLTTGGNFWFYIMGAVMFLVAAFVLAAGGVLLVIRFVALILIMIFSPVLFAATVFPKTEHYASELWSKLVSYSFFAPVYILLLLISISVLNGVAVTLGLGTTAKGLSTALSNSSQASDSFDVVLNFVIVIMFLIFSLQIAQKIGIKGGDTAVSWGNSLRSKGQQFLGKAGRFAGNVAMYAPRAGVRLGVGAGSKAALKGFDKWQAKDSNDQSTIGKGIRKALALTDSDRFVRGTLESGTKVKAGLAHSYKENLEYADERNKRTTANRAAAAREEAINVASDGKTTPTDTQMEDMVKAIKALTTDQMKDMDINVLKRSNVSVHISTKQLDELAKTGKYSDKEVDEIKDARKIEIKNIVDPSKTNGDVMVGNQSQRELLAQRGSDELAKMPIEVFTSPKMVPYLTPDIVEAKMKAGVSIAELDDIRKNIQEAIRTNQITGAQVQQWKKWAQRSPSGTRLGLVIP